MTEHKRNPSTADHIGQAAGGITGVFAGAAIGTTAGPLGTLLGGLAGAIGGWWSGRAIAEAAEDITEADATYYDQDFARVRAERRSAERAPLESDDHAAARNAYLVGDIAAANPAYGRFEDAESELERGWNECAKGCGEWRAVREYAAVGYRRGRERRSSPRQSPERREARGR